MNSITKRTIAVVVSAVALAAAASPSLAQTRSHHRTAAPQPPVQMQQEPYVSEGYIAPGYVHNPYECLSDEGNGRFSSCNNGSS